MTDIVIFDRQQLETRLDGDVDLVREILGLFRDDAPLQLAALEAAVAAGEWPAVTRYAHSIKGSSGNVGGLRVEAVSGALEAAARAGETGRARGLAQSLREELEALLKAISDAAQP